MSSGIWDVSKSCKMQIFQSLLLIVDLLVMQKAYIKSQEMIKTVLEAPTPKDVSQLGSLLGCMYYYSSFIPDLATVLYPLNYLLQTSRNWGCSLECQKAFL